MAPKVVIDWSFQSIERAPEDKCVLKFAHQWTKNHNFKCIIKFGNLKVEGKQCGCQIAKCDFHLGCLTRYRFSLRSSRVFTELHKPSQPGDYFILVEKWKECDPNAEINVKRAKKENLKTFFDAHLSPTETNRRMDDRGMPAAERLADRTISNRRQTVKNTPGLSTSKRYDGEFISTLKAFCNKDHENFTVITDNVIVTEERVSIPFYNKALSKIATGVSNAAGSIYWSMDATFNTNIHNLALLMIGVAASVLLSDSSLPSMRLVPIVFLVGHTENFEAYEAVIAAAQNVYTIFGIDIFPNEGPSRVSNV